MKPSHPGVCVNVHTCVRCWEITALVQVCVCSPVSGGGRSWHSCR